MVVCSSLSCHGLLLIYPVRDEWEAKKPNLEERVSKALGEPWTLKADMNLLYTQTDDKDYASRVGTVTTWYGLHSSHPHIADKS